jgi:hypothetical protein
MNPSTRKGWPLGILAALVVPLVLLVPLASAVAARALAPPAITVTQLAARSTPSGQRFRIDVLIDNQNVDPLKIKEVRFTMRVTGQGVLTGRYSNALTVEALDRRTIQVDVDSDALSSYSQLRANAAPDSTIGYEIYGNITLDRAFKNTLPFTADGAVPLASVDR